MMLPRVRAGPLEGASIYSGLSTSPWKPVGPSDWSTVPQTGPLEGATDHPNVSGTD